MLVMVIHFRLIISCYRKKFATLNMWKQTAKLKTDVVGPELDIHWLKEYESYKTRYNTSCVNHLSRTKVII